MFVYPDTSKMQYIIYRSDFHNLQIRKMSEMVQIIQTELDKTNPCMFYRPDITVKKVKITICQTDSVMKL